MNIRQNFRRHLAVVGLLIFLVGLVVSSGALQERTAEVVFWTEGIISQSPVIGMVVFVLVAAVSAIMAFFSVAVITPVAIYAWGQATCLALLWLGWFLGGIVSFSIGRFFGRSVAVAIIGEDKIADWEKQISKRSRFIHILIFQALVPSEIPGYLLGTLRYRFLLYLLALAITELPYAFATVYLGDSFLEGESTVFLVLGGGVLLIAAILWMVAPKRLRNIQ